MDLLENTDTALLSKWVSLYVAEMRKQDGSRYPLTQVYLHAANRASSSHAHLQPALPQLSINFLDTANQQFSLFHNALDNVFRQLQSEGVGSESKEAQGLGAQSHFSITTFVVTFAHGCSVGH